MNSKTSLQHIVNAIFLIFFLGYSANSQVFEWSSWTAGNSNTDRINNIATDEDQNLIITGIIKGQVDFCAGPQINQLNSVYLNAFIAKYNKTFELQWALLLNGSGTSTVNSLKTDFEGNIYVTGHFTGTINFQPESAGETLLTSNGLKDIFVAKYSPEGELIWVKHIGSSSDESSVALCVDTNQNIFYAGNFSGILDMDPGSGQFNLSTVSEENSLFVCKLNDSGEFLSAFQISGSSGNVARASDLDIDASDNLILSGNYSGEIDFDPDISGTFSLISNSGSNDAFVLKLNPAGVFQWVSSYSGDSEQIINESYIDQSGNIYSTGYFWAETDFDPGASTFNLTPSGTSKSFLVKLDNNGSFLWAIPSGGLMGQGIAIDTAGFVYLTGYFNYTSDFDPGTNTFDLTSSGIFDTYITKYNPDGTFVNANRLGGSDKTISTAISIDNENQLIIGGYFNGISDFHPENEIVIHESTGEDDFFLIKYGYASTASIEKNKISVLKKVYPNPSAGNFYISLSRQYKEVEINIYNTFGALVYSEIQNNTDFIEIDLKISPRGVYYLSLLVDNQLFRKTIEIQ